ncbi:MAG: aldehyde ferredoxin oxidoreductase family protein [Coriobacteriia bacterium]|nr:aldehyde ferredoxin oxidoreductase family protein [Coriobacteriia bacterium]
MSKTSYAGKVLRVNLTDETVVAEEVNLEEMKKFIGGRGWATKLLLDEGVATVDPLSPDNKVVIAAGPLTGAAAPTAGRYMVITKSPLTGMIASSNSGGFWGAALKSAGWDAVILEGKADEPFYLNIVDDKAELVSADRIWGMKTAEATAKIKEDNPDAAVLLIGPAGESQSSLACVMNDLDRAAGRSGVGAVVGSKNFKGIAVTSTASGTVDVTHPENLAKANKEAMGLLKENGVTGEGLGALGTAVLVNIINGIGSLPTRNWQESYDENADKISGETLADTLLVKNGACYRCPIACGRVIELDGEVIGGPEYETIWAYGSNCGVDNLRAISEANHLCNEFGLDSISAPCTIAAAMELYQRGIISEEACEGVPLKFGSAEAIVEWTRRMGAGETELGKLMSKGSYELCSHYGHPEYSMSVKKQDMPAYDARGVKGMGLTYATSNRGGCHVRGYLTSPEVLGIPEQLDRLATDGKALWCKIFQDLTAVIDSMGMCLFTSFALGAPQYADILNAATGTDYDADAILEVGERIYNLERMFNQAAGMKADADTLPRRLLDDPIVAGPSEGEIAPLDKMLGEYYELRGWEGAFPTAERKAKLGL